MTRESSTTPQRAIAQPDPRDIHQVPITLDPAAELVGCLLQMTPDQAAEVLAFVNDDDTTSTVAQVALGIIRHLISRGLSTNPAAVLAHARTAGIAVSADQQQTLAHYLVDCYQAAVWPGNGRFIGAAVVEAAYRRAGIEYAQAVTQAAEERGLAAYEQVLGDRDRLRDLWRRHRIAIGEPAAAASEIGGVA